MSHLSDELLNTYLGQMLDEVTQQSVEAHLTMCEQCSAQLSELEILFSTLVDLPDMPLTHDLTPGVLERLPKVAPIPALWRQPAFLMQSLLTIILLAVNMPILRELGQQAIMWRKKILLPTLQLLQFPSLSKIVTQLTPLLSWKPQFSLTLPELSFTLPTLPPLPVSLDANIVLMLVLSAGMLWMIGNFSLLRSKPEVRE